MSSVPVLRTANIFSKWTLATPFTQGQCCSWTQYGVRNQGRSEEQDEDVSRGLEDTEQRACLFEAESHRKDATPPS